MNAKTNLRPANDPFYMAGTEGTGEYKVISSSSVGRVGYRDLGGLVRIRLEPANKRQAAKIAEVLSYEDGWKQPEPQGQYRFSIVLPKGSEAVAAIEMAMDQIRRRRSFLGLLEFRRKVALNPAMPNYRKDLLA